MKHTTSAVDNRELSRAHLEQLLSSKTFQRSAKLAQLLRRLAEPTLRGTNDPVKEQILGIEVFERPSDWDPQTDSIVRVHVNRLRLMLTSYYADQDPPPTLRFVIPKGSYVAQCVLSSPENLSEPQPQKSPNELEKQEGSPHHVRLLLHRRPPRLSDIRLERLTYERGDLTNAVFCPDGESVVYSARWRGEPARFYWHRIGQRHSRPLGLPPGELRDVSSDGQLLFTLGEGTIGTLAQAELSGGPAREIVDGVLDAVWLPDNRHIAAARLEGGAMRMELPLGNPIHTLAGKQTRIRLSVDPTGERVAFVTNSLGPLDVCVAEANGNVRRISKEWRVIAGIRWISSNRLLVSGARRGVPAIHSIDMEGNERSFYPTPAPWGLHDCSHDGRVLASSMDTRLHIAFRTPSMAAEQAIFSVTNTRVVGLTPDARFAVLLDLLTDGVSRNSPILLMALSDGQPIQIAEGYHPQVAPDGKSVICLERQGSETNVLLTPIPSGLQRRYRLESGPRYHSVEFVGTADRYLLHLIDDSGALHSHIFDPRTGKLLPVAGERYVTLIEPNGSCGVIPGGSGLRLVGLDSGTVRNICSLANGWVPIRWSVRGNEIFVFEPGKDYAYGSIVRVNVQTGEQTEWLVLHPADSAGAYFLPWLDITPDGRSYAYTYQQDLCDLYIIDGLISGDEATR